MMRLQEASTNVPSAGATDYSDPMLFVVSEKKVCERLYSNHKRLYNNHLRR